MRHRPSHVRRSGHDAGRFLYRAARLASALLLTAGAATVAVAPAATAAQGSADTLPAGSDGAVDRVLELTGQPGPHRVTGSWFTSPGVPAAAEAARPAVLVGPSTPLLVGDSLCTAAVAGHDRHGNTVAVTAGHCGRPGTPVVSGDDPSRQVIGTVARVGTQDDGVVLLNDRARVTRSYNAATVRHLGGDASQVCKTGITTGTSCGPAVRFGNDLAVHLCAAHGDSGAPVYADDRLVGVLSGGLTGLPACVTPLQGPVHSPVLVTTWDAVAADLDADGGVGAGFRLP